MKTRRLLRNAGVMMIMGTMALMTAYAQEGKANGWGKDRGDQGGMMAKMAAKLNLSADQKAKIKSYQDQFNTTNASTLQQIKTLGEQMRQQRENQDTAGAKATRQQLMTKEKTLQSARQSLMTQIKGVLTTDQQAQLAQMREHGSGAGGGRGQGMGRN